MNSLSILINQGKNEDPTQIRANHRTARACFKVKCSSEKTAAAIENLFIGPENTSSKKSWAAASLKLHYETGKPVDMRKSSQNGRGHPDEFVLLEPSGSCKSAVSTNNGWFTLDSRAERPKKGKNTHEAPRRTPSPLPPPLDPHHPLARLG